VVRALLHSAWGSQRASAGMHRGHSLLRLRRISIISWQTEPPVSQGTLANKFGEARLIDLHQMDDWRLRAYYESIARAMRP
jgi:hypothetical protein